MKNSQRGSSLVELVMVMALLALFGVTIYTLITAGTNTQARIMREKDAQTDARIALSYVNVRLRQNDAAGKIAVEPIDLTGENALLIRERTWDYEYDTWIYCYNGKLYECLVDPGRQPDEISSFYIADADRLETDLDPETGTVTYTVWYYSDGDLCRLTSTVTLRSFQGGLS